MRFSNILAAIFPVLFIRAHNRLCRWACILRLSYIANLSKIFILPKQAFSVHSAQIQFFSNPLKFALTYWHSPTKNRNPQEECGFQMGAGSGFEPLTFRLWAWRATMLLHPASIFKVGSKFPPRRDCKKKNSFCGFFRFFRILPRRRPIPTRS